MSRFERFISYASLVIAIIAVIAGLAAVIKVWRTKSMPSDRILTPPTNEPQSCAKENPIPCVSTMDPTNFFYLTDLARRYDQTPFDQLVIPRLRYHFDERFALQSQSHDSSAMIMLFIYQSDEDWGQHELIDTSLKVWFGNDAGSVATIDIAGIKSLDAVRQKIYEIIQECEYTIIRFKHAELSRTSDIIQILQDVRHLHLPNKKVLDGSKAIYFFEYGVSKTHIHKEDILRLIGQYRKVVIGDPWQEYFDTVELVQNVTSVMFNSIFGHMLGSRMRVSLIPFLPIPRASIEKYLKQKAFRTLEPNTVFAQDQYLKIIEEQNPGIKVYKYIDDTDCVTSPLSIPCLRAQCYNVTCSPKKIQFTGKAATCTC